MSASIGRRHGRTPDNKKPPAPVTAWHRVTGTIVLAAFRTAAKRYGAPAATLTDIQRDGVHHAATSPPAGVVHIRRGVIRTGTGAEVKGPKSEAGKRDVNIPPHLMPVPTRSR